MLRSIGRHVHGNVVGYVALVLALGLGTAWGAGLAKNSVKSKQIKDGQVRSADLADGAVSGADVDEASLGQVPSASRADSATSADSAERAASAGDAGTLDGKDSTAFAPASAEHWHEVGGPGEPAFRSIDRNPSIAWGNYDAQHNTTAFYRDPYGRVHLKGLVCARIPECAPSIAGDSDPDDVFQLPPGYRPSRIIEQATISGGVFSRVEIQADGTVSAAPPYDFSSFYLDGVSFRCAPSGQDGCQ